MPCPWPPVDVSPSGNTSVPTVVPRTSWIGVGVGVGDGARVGLGCTIGEIPLGDEPPHPAAADAMIAQIAIAANGLDLISNPPCSSSVGLHPVHSGECNSA